MSKAQFDKLRIDMWVSGTADREGNGGYSALLYSNIKNQVYKKTIGGYGLDTTVTRMTLKAIVEGLFAIKNKSFIHIYTSIPQVSAGLNKNMYIWSKKDWKRKDGGSLKHSDLWEQVFELLQEKSISYKVHYDSKPADHDKQLSVVHSSSRYVMQAKKQLYEVALA